ncbi:hypothetical protein [Undibacterium sp.]|uniref:hypothetical protein n=1 Tax=Undibacterium sp. TaxID=1914977 RepID=UPI00374D8401
MAFLLLSSAWVLGVKQQLDAPTQSSRWVYDAYQHKIAAANAVKGPRVLVVAGSNAMFGIDSAQLESYWNRPVINLGVNAGLGLPYILNLSRRVARPGDVILMPLEYALYLDSGEANSQIIDYVIGRDMDYWRSLSYPERLRFAAGMAPERWIQGLRHLPEHAVTSGTYGAHHLDARGDQTHSSAAERTPADVAAVEATKPWSYGARAAAETGGWGLIADYARWAKANHICLVAAPTVLLHYSKYDTDPIEHAFYEALPEKISAAGIPYIGKPKDFMYPPSWFFDTDHHLQDWARKIHTAHLIKLLNPDPRSYCGADQAAK